MVSGGELIVSLTSHPPRYATLDGTILSLLVQSRKPDRIVLFVAEGHRRLLPDAVLRLADAGLEIVETADIGPFTKLIPALEAFPGSTIVTADDDIFYPRDWLEELEAGRVEHPGAIVCHRAHRVVAAADGGLEPYAAWGHDVQDEAARRPSVDLLPTGTGGILYPPGVLHRRVGERETFSRLCPTGDDLWFFWMARLNGSRAVKVGPRFTCRYAPDSQKAALWRENRDSRNDRMIADLVDAFGLPFESR
jgi:hypothetical protein